VVRHHVSGKLGCATVKKKVAEHWTIIELESIELHPIKYMLVTSVFTQPRAVYNHS
jgi:hypothetical protein